MEASEQLAGIEVKRGNKPGASRFLQDAIAAAEQGNFKEERKGLRRKLEELA